jgi:hypothetical protein
LFADLRINHVAIFTLPKSMPGFYEANIDFITKHAVDPDKKRYLNSLEGPRHFFDADCQPGRRKKYSVRRLCIELEKYRKVNDAKLPGKVFRGTVEHMRTGGATRKTRSC